MAVGLDIANPRSRKGQAAFTLIELLTVIAIIAILAGMLLPAFSKVRSKAYGNNCLGHLKEFIMAWRMYTEDNGDLIPPNQGAGQPGGWVQGWLSPDPNWADNTNTLYLKDSLLAPYLGAAKDVWRCPADKSTAVINRTRLPRVRSYSMNCWLNDIFTGTGWGNNPSAPEYRVIRMASEMVQPPPTMTFVILDEREDSINDAYFALDESQRGRSAVIVDWPSSYHNGAGSFSFADGHCESHKWQDARTMPSIGGARTATASPNNPDVQWLQDHATGPK